MVRNNEDRFGPRSKGGDETPATAPENLLQFVTPTEFHLSGSSFTTNASGPRVQYDTPTFGLKAASSEGPYTVVAQVCLPPLVDRDWETL